jgi:hypothetical protein
MKLTITIPKTESLTLTKSMAMKVNMFVDGIRYVPGPPGEDGVGFRWLGDYSSRAVYIPNDVILWPDDGNCYINILTCYGVLPSDPQYFEIFVSKGDQGEPPDNCVISTEISIIKKLTQEEYDALNPKLENTIYVIV